MRRLKVTLAYDGSAFLGWQQQKNGRTVEGEIRKALSFMHKHEVDIQAAGRTDSGVHANGQVISYTSDLDGLPLEKYVRALNSFFPHDIRARRVEVVSDTFHARHDALERSYRYYLYPSELPDPRIRQHAWRVVQHLDIRRLNAYAGCLVGRYDFTTFSQANEEVQNHERTVYASYFFAEGPFVVYYIAAQSFLWRMVRSLVGSMIEFEKQGLAVSDFRNKLAAARRSEAGPSAPAQGLFLHQVRYRGENLQYV